ncbi:MAG TPA: glycosyltransferase, partial [Candidatus Polarisedimenticolia bacterium]|nr:glycosyltransferase [Candidatus Polarisedimenticolia bacterium]
RGVLVDDDLTLLGTGRGALPFRFEAPREGGSYGALALLGETRLEIPRVLHVVWIGRPMPAKYRKNVVDFAEHNPLWTVKLCDDRAACSVVERMKNRDLFRAEVNVAAKVDLLRYELVYQEGGVYLDADTLSLGPGSLARMTHAFVTVSGPPFWNTGNAQFGFARGSEFLAYVIENARDPRVRARVEIPDRTGPTFFTTCVLSFGDLRIVHPNGRALLEGVQHLGDKNW